MARRVSSKLRFPCGECYGFDPDCLICERSGRTRRRGRRQPTAHDESCIDLTAAEADSFVDLTSSGANDASVIIIESPRESPERRRQRLAIPDTVTPQPERSRFQFPTDFDDDDDLPPVGFEVRLHSETGPSTSGPEVKSPPGLVITCPVCLDTDKEIKKASRRMKSTTCGHVFCSECIDSAVQSQRCCPVCRKRLTKAQTHVLHI